MYIYNMKEDNIKKGVNFMRVLITNEEKVFKSKDENGKVTKQNYLPCRYYTVTVGEDERLQKLAKIQPVEELIILDDKDCKGEKGKQQKCKDDKKDIKGKKDDKKKDKKKKEETESESSDDEKSD